MTAAASFMLSGSANRSASPQYSSAGIVRFWQNTPWAPLPNVSLHTVGDGDSDAGADGRDKGSRDALLDQAIELAHSNKKISTSLLQRRMRIGYPRAARLMDQLEDEGIVGPSDGSKSRDVIIGAGL